MGTPTIGAKMPRGAGGVSARQPPPSGPGLHPRAKAGRPLPGRQKALQRPQPLATDWGARHSAQAQRAAPEAATHAAGGPRGSDCARPREPHKPASALPGRQANPLRCRPANRQEQPRGSPPGERTTCHSANASPGCMGPCSHPSHRDKQSPAPDQPPLARGVHPPRKEQTGGSPKVGEVQARSRLARHWPSQCGMPRPM